MHRKGTRLSHRAQQGIVFIRDRTRNKKTPRTVRSLLSSKFLCCLLHLFFWSKLCNTWLALVCTRSFHQMTNVSWTMNFTFNYKCTGKIIWLARIGGGIIPWSIKCDRWEGGSWALYKVILEKLDVEGPSLSGSIQKKHGVRHRLSKHSEK